MTIRLPFKSRRSKETVARLARLPMSRAFMSLAVRTWVPRHRMGVAVVAFDQDQRVLMLRHVFHPFAPWGLPGGWLERDEDPAECALRELAEETGLSAVLGPIIQLARVEAPAHLIITYAADIVGGKLEPGPEIIEAAWFRPDHLPEPHLPFVRRVVRAALNERWNSNKTEHPINEQE